MPRNILPPEPAEVRAERISEHCRTRGPHLEFGGTVTVGEAVVSSETEPLSLDPLSAAHERLYN